MSDIKEIGAKIANSLPIKAELAIIDADGQLIYSSLSPEAEEIAKRLAKAAMTIWDVGDYQIKKLSKTNLLIYKMTDRLAVALNSYEKEGIIILSAKRLEEKLREDFKAMEKMVKEIKVPAPPSPPPGPTPPSIPEKTVETKPAEIVETVEVTKPVEVEPIKVTKPVEEKKKVEEVVEKRWEWPIDIGVNLVEEAKKEGIELRLIGGAAIRIHLSSETAELYKELRGIKGPYFAHADFAPSFAALSEQEKEVRKFLESKGWEFDMYIQRLSQWFGGIENRHIFRGETMDIDVFYDAIDLNHKVPFKDRINIHPLTLSPTDLLLIKLQRVKFSEDDAKDVIVLLRDLQIDEEDDPEIINAKYIAKLLADDWGFWYTATTNLKRVKEDVKNYGQLSEEDKQTIISKIDLLLKYIEEEPKTEKWIKRSKKGTKKKWYKEVEL